MERIGEIDGIERVGAVRTFDSRGPGRTAISRFEQVAVLPDDEAVCRREKMHAIERPACRKRRLARPCLLRVRRGREPEQAQCDPARRDAPKSSALVTVFRHRQFFSHIPSRTSRDKGGLEAQEVEDVAGGVGITVAGVGLTGDETVLEA